MYHAALARDVGERMAFLRETCAGDVALRREVELLLAQQASFEGARDMTPERWERIQELYHAARVCAEGDRAQFLTHACAGDAALQREVQALLDQPVSTGSFIDFVGGPASCATQRCRHQRSHRPAAWQLPRAVAPRTRRHGRSVSRARREAWP